DVGNAFGAEAYEHASHAPAEHERVGVHEVALQGEAGLVARELLAMRTDALLHDVVAPGRIRHHALPPFGLRLPSQVDAVPLVAVRGLDHELGAMLDDVLRGYGVVARRRNGGEPPRPSEPVWHGLPLPLRGSARP